MVSACTPGRVLPSHACIIAGPRLTTCNKIVTSNRLLYHGCKKAAYWIIAEGRGAPTGHRAQHGRRCAD
jgi:hypothetical protein